VTVTCNKLLLPYLLTLLNTNVSKESCADLCKEQRSQLISQLYTTNAHYTLFLEQVLNHSSPTSLWFSLGTFLYWLGPNFM